MEKLIEADEISDLLWRSHKVLIWQDVLIRSPNFSVDESFRKYFRIGNLRNIHIHSFFFCTVRKKTKKQLITIKTTGKWNWKSIELNLFVCSTQIVWKKKLIEWEEWSFRIFFRFRVIQFVRVIEELFDRWFPVGQEALQPIHLSNTQIDIFRRNGDFYDFPSTDLVTHYSTDTEQNESAIQQWEDILIFEVFSFDW